jgi:hypothetical protein
MAALYVITLHLYAFRWYVDTTRVLNQHIEAKISSGFMALCVGLTLLNFALAIASRVAGGWLGWPELVRSLLHSAEWVLWLIWTLRLRWRLNEVAHEPARPEFEARSLLSWLFQLFYLQFKINQILDSRSFRRAPPL